MNVFLFCVCFCSKVSFPTVTAVSAVATSYDNYIVIPDDCPVSASSSQFHYLLLFFL